jgi:hypothetical protein
MDPNDTHPDVDEVPVGYWDKMRARVSTWPMAIEDDAQDDFDGFASEALDEE